MQDLFIELFPILSTDLPDLTAYRVQFDGEAVGARGGKISLSSESNISRCLDMVSGCNYHQ